MKEIALALTKAQKEFGPALKTNVNSHFRNKYADLAACISAVIDGLNNNGIYLMQVTHEHEQGVLIETLFIHESGEQMSAGKLFMPATKFDAQGFGSALSYARRYSLMAACGIAPEDDDANTAVKSHQNAIPKATPKEANVPPIRPAVAATPVPQVSSEAPKESRPPEQARENAPASTLAPPKMQGKADQWQLKITVDPGTNLADWIDVVKDSSVFMLEMAQSKNDTLNIFRTNANIYNQLKSYDEVAFESLMGQFKIFKEKLND